MRSEDKYLVACGLLLAIVLSVSCCGCAEADGSGVGYGQGWHQVDAPYRQTNVRADRGVAFSPEYPLEMRVEGYTDDGEWFSGGTRMHGRLVTVVVPSGYYDVWLSETVEDLFVVQSAYRKEGAEQ